MSLKELHQNIGASTDVKLGDVGDDVTLLTIGELNAFIAGDGASNPDDVPLTNSKTCKIQMSFSTPTSIEGRLYVSTEGGYDFVKVYVNGVMQISSEGHLDDPEDDYTWRQFIFIISRNQISL